MLYYFLKFTVRIFYRVFYKIQVRNVHYIDTKKATIIAPNHVNGFVDPTILAILPRKEVHFFARGDVFRKRIARYFLRSLNIGPMYRLQEGGLSEVRKNDRSFEECKKLLSENKNVILFPEAVCVQEKRVRKLKKGLARIAFMTEDSFDFKKDVQIVPVGLNYSQASKMRSTVFIDFGKPFSLKEYEQKYREDKVRAINELTAYLQERMEELLVVIENPQNDKLVSGIEEIVLHGWMKKENYSRRDLAGSTMVSRSIAAMINYFDTKFPQRIESLNRTVIPYLENLRSLNLRDHLLRKESIEKMGTLRFFLDFIIIWFGLPLYFAGMVMNHPPYFVAGRFTAKKIRQIEFAASVHANLAWLLWYIWYGLQLLTVALVFRNWMVLGIYAVAVPVMLSYVLYFYPVMKKIFGKWRLLRSVRKQKTEIEKLMYAREDIVHELETMRKEFLAVKN